MNNFTKQIIIRAIQGRVHGVREAIKRDPWGWQGTAAHNYIAGFLAALHTTGAINFNEWKTWESVACKYIEMVSKGEQNAEFDH